jgi:hypothetical protein
VNLEAQLHGIMNQLTMPLQTDNNDDVELEYILRCCEMYGRFVLHKVALSDSFTSFNESAQKLLDWTSKRVIAAFTLSLDDIQFDNGSPIVSSPLSPIPTGPPRRRFNRNNTPNKESVGSSVSGASTLRDQEAAIFVARAFATTLLQASCVIFAEWLAVGCAGGDQIGRAAASWIKIFCIDDVGAAAQHALLPAFGRLAVQLSRHTSHHSLLKSLLLECKVDSTEDDLSIQKVFSTICASRDASVLASCVTLVIDAGLETTQSQQSSVNCDRVSKSAIKSALMALISSKQACVELAKQLVDQLNNSGESFSDIQLKFMISTLQLIFDDETCSCHESVAPFIRQIRLTDFDSNEDLQDAARELVNIVAT